MAVPGNESGTAIYEKTLAVKRRAHAPAQTLSPYNCLTHIFLNRIGLP